MRVLVTRPRKEAPEFAHALGKIGAEAIFFPTIAIQPVKDTTALDRAFSRLQDYDWLIFTSANAVDVVLERKAALGIEYFPETLRIAAIGPKTAARLVEGGVSPHFIPEEHLAEAILPGLGDLSERWVLLPTADIAHDTLPQAIQKANGVAHVVTVYRTSLAEPGPEGVAALRAGVDILTFTSGSTVKNFVLLAQRAGLDPFRLPGNPIVACIGPKTAQAALDLGYPVAIIASPYTAEGLALAIAAHTRKIHAHDIL